MNKDNLKIPYLNTRIPYLTTYERGDSFSSYLPYLKLFSSAVQFIDRPLFTHLIFGVHFPTKSPIDPMKNTHTFIQSLRLETPSSSVIIWSWLWQESNIIWSRNLLFPISSRESIAAYEVRRRYGGKKWSCKYKIGSK